MEQLTDYFKITEYSGRQTQAQFLVSWPGYERQVATNVPKTCGLLNILFDKIKLDQPLLKIIDFHKSGEYTMYINLAVYWQNPEVLINHMINFDRHLVVGAVLPTREQAEHLVEELEKRIVWMRLRRDYDAMEKT